MSRPDPQRSHPDNRTPSRARRYSAWSLLAPLALLAVVIALVHAVSTSCLGDSCRTADDKVAEEAPNPSAGSAKASTRPGTEARKLPAGQRRYRVKRNDTAEQIAQQFGLTTPQLKACNPDTLADSYDLQAGEMLWVTKSQDGKPCNSFDEAGTSV